MFGQSLLVVAVVALPLVQVLLVVVVAVEQVVFIKAGCQSKLQTLVQLVLAVQVEFQEVPPQLEAAQHFLVVFHQVAAVLEM
jgi:hypothetical protein